MICHWLRRRKLEMNVKNTESYRARFRFRLLKKLNLEAHEHRINVSGRDVTLSPAAPDIAIRDSEWLVMNVRGFDSAEDAKAFATNLKAACEASSIATRLGIDSGVDLPTAGLGQQVRERVREQSGLLIRDNVHGIDVFPDDSNVRILNFSASGSILAAPDPFLADLNSLHHTAANTSRKTKDVILLLNYALMRPEPVAQIVFAISAVEMLGQQEDWSDDQRRLLSELASAAERAEIGTPDERAEVAAAIGTSVHKLSLRQGVLRLLASLGLTHLKREWDDLYTQRSTLIHGLAPKPGADYGGLASKAVSLCGQILLKVVATEVALANRYVDKYYAT
jgi:hypothetical protein